MLTDAEFNTLMAQTRAGDEHAARELVRLYEPEIRRAARVRLTDPKLRRVVDSIDICQSVFGRFFKNATNGAFEIESSQQLLGLLVTMTRNRVIDIHREQSAQKRRPGADEDSGFTYDTDGLVYDSPGPRTAAAAKEMLSDVRSRLKPHELQIADRRTAGDSWANIAKDLGENVDVLRKRLERALARVRDEVEAGFNNGNNCGTPPV